MAAAATEIIWKLKFELFSHLAYNPDVVPYDFHTFGLLKYVLHGEWSANDEKVKDAVHMLLHTQPKTLFTDDIKKLIDQSNKCVGKLQDYIEKSWYICSCLPFVQ
jgi:hypothetical protein